MEVGLRSVMGRRAEVWFFGAVGCVMLLEVKRRLRSIGCGEEVKV